MMPISLTLSAFGPYPDTITIDFESFQEDGLFLITGPTGSGKTMIFDAMIFALYGKTSGQIRETDSLRCDHALNEIPTFVEFSFSLHQQNYTIKRNPKYYLEGKKTPKQPSALLILPDGKMVEGIKEVNQKMISLLGLCYAFFATLAILIVGLPISVVVSREMGSATLHGKVVPYQFPVLEMGLFILVLFGMELILSVWTIRRQKKQSLIEQMRAME